MSGDTKVLAGLMRRRALEAAFDELGKITDPDQLARRAEETAQHGSAVLPVLLSRLDTSDPQLRGGLGRVAALLDRNVVVPALRDVARSRERSDASHLTALTILDRFLHEPIDDALMQAVQDPDAVARQSLLEFMHEMSGNQFSVIEYLNQLAEQPPEVARMIVDAIPRLPADPHLVTLLRMIAQGEELGLATKALELLSRTRTVDAFEALISLSATLPASRAALAERGLRKLRLSGIQQTAGRAAQLGQDDGAWRALLSPIDAGGGQVVWFVNRAAGKDHGQLLSLLVRDAQGIVAGFGASDVPAEALPASALPGTLHTIAQSDDGPQLQLLEVFFDTGRQVVYEALELNWQSGSPTPLEYRLLNPAIWRVAFETDPELLPIPSAKPGVPGQSAALLDHPAFAGWYWQSAELTDLAHGLGLRLSTGARTERIAELARRMTPEAVRSYQRRLTGMARWLTLASQPEAAALAQSAAEELGTGSPADSAFMRRLIGVGLDIAVLGSRAGITRQRKP